MYTAVAAAANVASAKAIALAAINAAATATEADTVAAAAAAVSAVEAAAVSAASVAEVAEVAGIQIAAVIGSILYWDGHTTESYAEAAGELAATAAAEEIGTVLDYEWTDEHYDLIKNSAMCAIEGDNQVLWNSVHGRDIEVFLLLSFNFVLLLAATAYQNIQI